VIIVKQRGVLVSWFESGYGFVIGEGRRQFFLHTTTIVEGPAIPVRGSMVEFEIAPPYNGGKLPQAVNARILPEGGEL
jgi:cold shock CspA family protein